MKQIVEDKSQLILTILAMILASFAIGQNFSESNARAREREDVTRIIRSEVDRGIAEAKAAMQEQVATAKADMHLAATNALLAKDRTDKVAAALEARGLIKLENH